MATLTRSTLAGWATDRRILTWAAVAVALGVLLTLLTVSIKNDPLPSQDVSVRDSIRGWDVVGLSGFFDFVSFLTAGRQAFVIGAASVGFLWLIGMQRAAVTFGIVGIIIGVVAVLGDYTLGHYVGRVRPEAVASSVVAYPSGHVFSSVVFFGFWAFLGVYYRVPKPVLVPLLLLSGLLISSVGLSRIFVGDHWPSDVAAGYLLGGIWLLLLVPFFIRVQRVPWWPVRGADDDLDIIGCEHCRTERSIASEVVLDPAQGTATKVYRPPGIVRALYWLAFQASFPYESNQAALEAADYRRRIASFLTLHRFGKDLVAAATSANCMHGKCAFVTEFIPGDKVDNDEPTRAFLAQVTETFADAGLGVWQINPKNPHAHTNLIRTASGDLKIIDLESAVVTPIPAPGQWRSAIRRGSIPVFDDIDFERLRLYINRHESSLEAALGKDGLAAFHVAVDKGEHAIRSWKDAEPRIWGKLISGIYRLFNWKAFFHHLSHAMEGAEKAGETVLERGISRWEASNKMTPEDATRLRRVIDSGEARDGLRHLGAHVILSLAIVVPIPGLRSAARARWTAANSIVYWLARLRRRATGRTNIHSPLVMVVSLLPAVGAIAYLTSRPLREKPLGRVMVDQVAWRLPLRLYKRLNLERWLTPRLPVRDSAPEPVTRES